MIFRNFFLSIIALVVIAFAGVVTSSQSMNYWFEQYGVTRCDTLRGVDTLVAIATLQTEINGDLQFLRKEAIALVGTDSTSDGGDSLIHVVMKIQAFPLNNDGVVAGLFEVDTLNDTLSDESMWIPRYGRNFKVLFINTTADDTVRVPAMPYGFRKACEIPRVR